MEKEKQRRAWLGLRKKKEAKRRKIGGGGGGKSFAKKVADYLLSDSYMYAPIANSPLPLPSPAPKTATGGPTSPATTKDKTVSVVHLRRLLVNECTSPTSPLCT